MQKRFLLSHQFLIAFLEEDKIKAEIYAFSDPVSSSSCSFFLRREKSSLRANLSKRNVIKNLCANLNVVWPRCDLIILILWSYDVNIWWKAYNKNENVAKIINQFYACSLLRFISVWDFNMRFVCIYLHYCMTYFSKYYNKRKCARELCKFLNNIIPCIFHSKEKSHNLFPFYWFLFFSFKEYKIIKTVAKTILRFLLAQHTTTVSSSSITFAKER